MIHCLKLKYPLAGQFDGLKVQVVMPEAGPPRNRLLDFSVAHSNGRTMLLPQAALLFHLHAEPVRNWVRDYYVKLGSG